MKLVVGYDRDLAVQFFLRTFSGFVETGQAVFSSISREEQEYVAGKLADTLTHSFNTALGSPWFWGDIEALVLTTSRVVDRELFDQAECAANQILVLEGIVAHGGLWNITGTTRKAAADQIPKESKNVAQILFQNASRWSRLNAKERYVLRNMSAHVPLWVSLLAMVSGNDYLEGLGSRPSTILHSAS